MVYKHVKPNRLPVAETWPKKAQFIDVLIRTVERCFV